MNKAENVLKHIPYGILIEDENRCINLVNDEFIRIFNIPLEPAQLKGLDCEKLAEQAKEQFVEPETFELFINACLHTKKKSDPTTFEIHGNRFLEVVYLPYFVAEQFKGHSWCYTEVTSDIINIKQIAKQREFFQKMLDSMPADIAIFDDTHKYLFLNRNAIKSDEIRNWLIGKDDFDYCKFKNINTDLAANRRAKFDEMVASKQSAKWEDCNINETGDEITTLRILHPLYEKDKLEFVIGYGIDVSEIKKKDLKLREEERKSNELINQLKEIVFNIDCNGKFESLNPAWESVTGFSIDQTLATNIKTFITEIEGLHQLEEFIADQDTKELTITIPIKTINAFKWVEAFFSKKLVNNQLIGCWGTLADITDRKKAQDDLLENLQKERELNDLKSRFVNMVSHEVRTPLAGILSSVELLEIIHQNSDEPIKAKSFNHFSRIKGQILRLGDLMNDVLMLGKIEAGKVELNLEEINVAELMPAFIAESFNLYTDNLQINVKVEGEPFVIKLDWNIMKHILVNLLSNAIKYSPNQKSPEVEIIFLTNSLKVHVIDYGIGIPKSDMERLFNPFSRASNVGNIGGTGLGLTLVKHFIEMHGGKVYAKSKVGKGSVFSFTIPRRLS